MSMKRLLSSIATGAEASKLPILVACILERLPILMPSPPQWEVEHHVFLRDDALKHGLMKDYEETSPSQEAKTSSNDNATIKKFIPVSEIDRLPISSMRRELSERLFLMVKSPNEARWRFPSVEIKKDEETLRDAGERALSAAMRREKPVFFIGNAPIGHLPSAEATTFFMLAQVVGEPFNVKLKDGASEVAWMTKREVLEQVGEDEGEGEGPLLEKML